MGWVYKPLIGPLYIKGIRRTPDENIKYIRYCNIILLSDPNLIIRNKKGDYYDWAYSEFRKRAIISSIAWLIMVSLFGIWIYKQKNKKSITNGVI